MGQSSSPYLVCEDWLLKREAQPGEQQLCEEAPDSTGPTSAVAGLQFTVEWMSENELLT